MFNVHFLLLFGCQSDDWYTEGLTEQQVLIRASLDLRGRLPSREELEDVKGQSLKVYDQIDDFLEDDGFGLRIRDLFAGAYRTRSAIYNFTGESAAEFERDAGEEILKLIEYIAIEDRPFSEVVTADYTFANSSMLDFWPISGYDEEEGGWQMVSYDDGRPHAGVISTNSFHSRYLSNDENYNRNRANALSRILLCDNFLLRPIDFPREIDLTDENAIDNAIRENAACASCHANLDPIASFLFGFPGQLNDGLYNEESVWDWEDTTGQAPSFYGIYGDDLSDLGAAIANDPRFAKCTTKRVFEGLVGRKALPEDAETLRGYQDAFVESDMSIKTLIKSIIRDPVYQGRMEDGRLAVGSKIMSPETLELAVMNLTGYQMQINGVSLLRSDHDLHVLGGGLSHKSGDYASTTSNVTRVLVQSQLAEAAGFYLVEGDSEYRDRIFAGVEMEADEPSRSAITRMYTLILGSEVSTDDPEVEELAELWQMLAAEDLENPAFAWAGVISVLLRDPRFIHY